MNNKEILKLKEMLEKANIPFKYTDDKDHILTRPDYKSLPKQLLDDLYPYYQIIISDKEGNRLCDAVLGYGTYGNEEGLLEIMNALTIEEIECDSVMGYLDAEEVFKRFKYCYEHNTEIYRKEKL